MPNSSSSATFNRRANVGADTKPLTIFRARKRSAQSGSCKLRRCEPNHFVEVPEGTEVFEEMFVASRRQFVAIAYSILRNREDAEDAVHNAFVSGYVHLSNFQGRSALKTWFTRVVLNAALMIRRKRRPAQLKSAADWALEEGGEWMDAIPSPRPDPEMCYAKAEELGVVHEVSAQLKPRLREAFSMYYGNGMSVKQGRALAGVSMPTFKARLFRATHQVIGKARRSLVGPQKKGAPGESSPSLVSKLPGPGKREG
jgi:RNA polymerase sigma-70 factor, ECF subfamily